MNITILAISLFFSSQPCGGDLYLWKHWMLTNGVISQWEFNINLNGMGDIDDNIVYLNDCLEECKGYTDYKYIKEYRKHQDLIWKYYDIAYAHRSYLSLKLEAMPNDIKLKTALDVQEQICIAYDLLRYAIIDWIDCRTARDHLSQYLAIVGPEYFYNMRLPSPVELNHVEYQSLR